MADNITIDLDTATEEQKRKLRSIGFGGDIDKKLEIHDLTIEKAKIQKRLAELRK